jgi:hypothetical protein
MVCLIVIVSTTKSPIHCPLTTHDPARRQSPQLTDWPKCIVLELFEKNRRKRRRGVVRITIVITEKTKIYFSESQRASAGPSVKVKLQEN